MAGGRAPLSPSFDTQPAPTVVGAGETKFTKIWTSVSAIYSSQSSAEEISYFFFFKHALMYFIVREARNGTKPQLVQEPGSANKETSDN